MKEMVGHSRRLLRGCAGAIVAVALLTAASTMTTAYAESTGAWSAKSATTSAFTVTPVGNGAMTLHISSGTAATALATPAPSTSPSVTHVFVPNGGAFQCGPGGQLGDGWACAVVPYSNGAYVFKFFNYGGYSVSNWHGTGSVVNLQSGGAAFRIDRLDGSQIHCYAPRQAAYNLVGWEPVWRVRLTASGC